MIKYILRRLLMFLPVLLGVTLVIFIIMDFTPGDPARMILGDQASQDEVEALRENMGLNDPLMIRYVRYFFNCLKGDLGTSYKSQVDVSEEIGARFPNTLKLSLAGSLMAIVLALPLGILAAIKQNSIFDSVSMFIALIGISMPAFWMGLLLMLLFSLKLGWLPVFGADTWRHMILPAVTLGFTHMASIARTTRSSMLEVIRLDYVRTARSKGLPYRQVILQHALPNAMIPTITVIGLQMGILLGGSVLTETVFSWPGIGRLMIQSIQSRDTPLVLGCIICLSVCFSIVNLIVDLLYGFVDPRLRLQTAGEELS